MKLPQYRAKTVAVVLAVIVGVALYAPHSVRADEGSITINSVQLTLSDDADSNGYANIGDSITVDANVSNADGGCDEAETTATVDLTKYGLTGTEPLNCVDDDETSDLSGTFVITDAGESGISVGANDSGSEVTVSVTDDDDVTPMTANSNPLGDGDIDTATTEGVDTAAPTVVSGYITGPDTASISFSEPITGRSCDFGIGSICGDNEFGQLTINGQGTVDIVASSSNEAHTQVGLTFTSDPPIAENASGSITLNPTRDTIQDAAGNLLPANTVVSLGNSHVMYVDSAWNGPENAGGHVWHVDAFATIQGGIDAVADGGTIHVAPGTYDEEIDINKPLTLEGSVPESGRGPAEGAPEIFDDICDANSMIAVGADDVTIEGFSVVDDCTGNDAVTGGNGTSGLHVLNNELFDETGTSYGVLLQSGISGDEIARNVIHGFYSGVSTQEPDSITITDNDINHNTGQGVTVVAASGGVDIAGNTIDSNGASHGQNPYGIWLFEVNDASVSNNSLSNNVQVGIFLADSTDNTLIGNMVTGSKVGIRLQLNSNGNTLSDNAVEDNASGFNLFSSSGNTLTHNFAIGNAVDGFYLTNNSNDNTLNDNIAGYNTNGIHNVNSSGTVIDSNVIGVAVIGGMPIFGNSQDGILIDSGSDISITNNQILLNPTEGSGIHLGGGAGTGIVAHYNNISYNGPWGILNDSDNVIDATLNFWGSSAGPGVDGNNNANDYDLVTVAPFLASNSPQLVDGKIPGNLFTTVLQYNGTASSSTQITVYGDVVLSVASSSVDLPNLTTIISATSFNVASVSLGTPDLGTLSGLAGGNVVKGALQWGIPNLSFSFDPAITLHIWVGRDLDGQVLQIVRSPSGTGDWTTDGLVDTTCTVTDGVCTFHATKASTYVPCLGTCTTGGGSSHHETPTPTPTPPPSGGGVAYVPPMPSPTPTPTPTPTVCRRAENSLVRYQGDTKVYVIQNCIKHWIMTADDFNRFGYNWAAITVIPSSETYPDGSTVGTGTPAPTPTPSGTYIFTKFLSRGSRGEEVRQLQLKLKSLGFFPADIDATGVFGSTTTAAVKAFQKANSIAQLGFVGPATRAALNR